ncbi:MAG: radical SAM protein [Myxococcota bacterium]|nr:radical SAM protein [Myxococcota bacterium]
MTTVGIQWHLTHRCNLRCAHCYQDRFDNNAPLAFSDITRIADSIFSAFEHHRIAVNLTGGEPLLLPYLGELIAGLCTFDTLDEVTIITNGTIFDSNLARQLGQTPGFGTVKVSIESADPEINDRIRGPGSFERATSGMLNYLNAGLEVAVMMTLAKYNLSSIEKTVAWARQIGASGVIFERFVPLGVGQALARETLDAHGWRDAVDHIIRSSEIDATPDDLVDYRAFWLDTSGGSDVVLRGAPCNLGPFAMAIMPDGTVYPCRRLTTAMGNVVSDPWDAIAERLARFAPKALRPHIAGEGCGQCDRDGCMGCRALVQALTGDLLGHDPQCYL